MFVKKKNNGTNYKGIVVDYLNKWPSLYKQRSMSIRWSKPFFYDIKD